MAYMGNQIIFVSCGQLTEAEKSLGVLIKTIIDGTPGFHAYFAETVHDLDALAHHVLKGLQECVGAVVVLHDRGGVAQTDGLPWGHRSSVWVNQEVAILAYRQFFESMNLPILAFADPAVKLEGAMTSLIVNPKPIPSASEVVGAITAWLSSAEFSHSSGEVFLSKWGQLTESDRMVIAALIDEGGKNVKHSSIRQTLAKRFDIAKEAAGKYLQESKLQFISTDLVKLISNIHSGDELSMNPTWEFNLRRQCAAWLAERNKA